MLLIDEEVTVLGQYEEEENFSDQIFLNNYDEEKDKKADSQYPSCPYLLAPPLCFASSRPGIERSQSLLG